jgi:hypothetical protein
MRWPLGIVLAAQRPQAFAVRLSVSPFGAHGAGDDFRFTDIAPSIRNGSSFAFNPVFLDCANGGTKDFCRQGA